MHFGIIVNPWSMIVKEVLGTLTTSRIDIISREIGSAECHRALLKTVWDNCLVLQCNKPLPGLVLGKMYINTYGVTWEQLLLRRTKTKHCCYCCNMHKNETMMISDMSYNEWLALIYTGNYHWRFNSSPPGQNGRHLADDIFRCIFVNEKFCLLITISLKFVPKGPIDNNPALVEIMVWRRIGDKPLSEPMLIPITGVYMRH